MSVLYQKCLLCPRKCGIDRTKGIGLCGEGDKIRISRASLHFWEEPCISGKRGSGTVFFSGCALRCIYCQNSDIALSHSGVEISEDRLVEIFFELKNQGAHNVNLVTPSHFTPSVVSAIDKAKSQGFDLPFVWNSSGYEERDTLELLRGRIDIFLPDLKYLSSESAKKFSHAPDYFEKASRAIDIMVDITGAPKLNEESIMTSGTIVRHLVLPAHSGESIEIMKYLRERYGDKIYVSIMNQYTPMRSDFEFRELSRRLTTYEYEKVVNFASDIGITNGFIQGRGAAKESFIPAFDHTGVFKE